MISSAKLTIDIKRDGNFLYQTIKITPTKNSHTRYYLLDRYVIGRAIDDYLSKLYLGDAINIFFEEKQKFRSQIMIKYRIENEVGIDMSTKNYHIKGNIPQFDGCIFCANLKKSKNGNDRCTYYRKFLDKYKTHCSDFIEKDN